MNTKFTDNMYRMKVVIVNILTGKAESFIIGTESGFPCLTCFLLETTLTVIIDNEQYCINCLRDMLLNPEFLTKELREELSFHIESEIYYREQGNKY